MPLRGEPARAVEAFACRNASSCGRHSFGALRICSRSCSAKTASIRSMSQLALLFGNGRSAYRILFEIYEDAGRARVLRMRYAFRHASPLPI
jgi:hypothetical protein